MTELRSLDILEGLAKPLEDLPALRARKLPVKCRRLEGLQVLIDQDDYPLVSSFDWRASRHHKCRRRWGKKHRFSQLSIYAWRTLPSGQANRPRLTKVFLQNFIRASSPSEKVFFINGNRLDFRKCNLITKRIAEKDGYGRVVFRRQERGRIRYRIRKWYEDAEEIDWKERNAGKVKNSIGLPIEIFQPLPGPAAQPPREYQPTGLIQQMPSEAQRALLDRPKSSRPMLIQETWKEPRIEQGTRGERSEREQGREDEAQGVFREQDFRGQAGPEGLFSESGCESSRDFCPSDGQAGALRGRRRAGVLRHLQVLEPREYADLQPRIRDLQEGARLSAEASERMVWEFLLEDRRRAEASRRARRASWSRSSAASEAA